MVAGAVALAVDASFPGYLFIVAGALAGALEPFWGLPMDSLLAGSAGPYLAIAAMAVATYLCRAAGVALMAGCG